MRFNHMELTFERGDASRPAGHALLYFTTGMPERVLATYLVVPPVELNLAKYMPPMFAASLPTGAATRDADDERRAVRPERATRSGAPERRSPIGARRDGK